jgi:hypothetical protein
MTHGFLSPLADVQTCVSDKKSNVDDKVAGDRIALGRRASSNTVQRSGTDSLVVRLLITDAVT